MVIARTWLRLRIHSRRLLASDVLLTVAWVTGCATASFHIFIYTHGSLEAVMDYALLRLDFPDPKTFVYALKLLWVAVFRLHAYVPLHAHPRELICTRRESWPICNSMLIRVLVSRSAVTSPDDFCPVEVPLTVFRVA